MVRRSRDAGNHAGELLRAIRFRLKLVRFICAFLPDFTLTTARTELYRLLGVRAAKRVSFLGMVTLAGRGSNPYRRLVVGEDTIISVGVLFHLDDEIRIGQRVEIAQFVRIYAGRGVVGPTGGTSESGSVLIEDGAWIGVGSTLLPGARIGAGAVVSAGSVVSGDVPPDTLVSGVPATVVRVLTPDGTPPTS
jgi:acetyltransferase-like isoleucine patch superfamily enzyme